MTDNAPAGPRYADWPEGLVCLDCGAIVAERTAHTRFHSILSGHAWMLAILKTAHVAPSIHDKYDVAERESRRKFDSWSADALAEVMAGRGAADAIVPGVNYPPPWQCRDERCGLVHEQHNAGAPGCMAAGRGAADGGDTR